MRKKKLQTNVWKIINIYWASSSQVTPFKPGKYNLPPSISTLPFTNCVKFDFAKSYLPPVPHTNTVISDRFAYPSRWRRKSWWGPCFSFDFQDLSQGNKERKKSLILPGKIKNEKIRMKMSIGLYLLCWSDKKPYFLYNCLGRGSPITSWMFSTVLHLLVHSLTVAFCHWDLTLT